MITAPVSSVLLSARLIFWDFDGVIKESVAVKAMAFEPLFLTHGEPVAARVRRHHEANGRMSRFDKMPIYLSWADELVSPELVATFCERFGEEVRDAVIASAWVPGVEQYLRTHRARRAFVLVSAAPQDEIAEIVEALELTDCFREVHGAPTPKATVIRNVRHRTACPDGNALVVGDSDSDYNAAQANGVRFVLRRTALNLTLQGRHHGASFETLDGESAR